MARAAEERSDRRGDIARALYRCICEQGYANTTLKDLADRAEMSASHVGYYFDNKAAVLAYYAERICEQNLAALPDLAEPDRDRLLDEVADFCLGAGQMSKGLGGVIQELTGLAVHDPTLHEIKARHTRAWRAYLEALFEQLQPGNGVSARDAAFQAHAIVVGLNTNALFDSSLGRADAHRILRSSLAAHLQHPIPRKSRAAKASPSRRHE